MYKIKRTGLGLAIILMVMNAEAQDKKPPGYFPVFTAVIV